MDTLLLCFIFLLSHEISFFPALWQKQKPVLFGIIISNSCEQEPFYSALGCETQAHFKEGEETRGANMKLKIVLEPHMDSVLVDYENKIISFGRDNISLTQLLCLLSKNYDKMNLKLQ